MLFAVVVTMTEGAKVKAWRRPSVVSSAVRCFSVASKRLPEKVAIAVAVRG